MKKSREKRDIIKVLKQEIKKSKSTFAVYVILRLFVLMAIVLSVIRGQYENVFMCVLALTLFLVPSFFKRNLGIELPSVLEIIIMLFIFCSIILGEIGCYYVKVPVWDTVLHTVNGFLCAAIGFSLVDVLNRNERFKFNLSPLYLSIVAFCFSMTIGVMWEMYEFGADAFFSTDMQKDFVINKISTVTLDSTLTNTPVVIDQITSVSVNGIELGLGGCRVTQRCYCLFSCAMGNEQRQAYKNYTERRNFQWMRSFYITSGFQIPSEQALLFQNCY